MSACETYRALVSAFLDRQLSQEDEENLQRHLDSCPACRAYLADQLAIREALHGLEAQAPAGFADSVMEKVSVTAQEKPKRAAFPQRWRTAAALAACFAVVACAGVFVNSLRMGSSGSSASYDTAETVSGAAAPQSLEEGATETTADQPTDGGEVETEATVDSAAVETEGTVVTLSTASDLAKTWVEDNLGEDWVLGASYQLTGEQFDALETMLSDAGEEFALTGDPDDAGEYVLEAG